MFFVPTTPNPTSGFLLFVPKCDLHYLAMSPEEGFKMLVSTGIVTPVDKSADIKNQPTILVRGLDLLPNQKVCKTGNH